MLQKGPKMATPEGQILSDYNRQDGWPRLNWQPPDPQHPPIPLPSSPLPSLYGSSSQGGGVLCVCKTMYSVTSVLL